MVDGIIQLPPDSTGKELRTQVVQTTKHQQVVTLAGADGSTWLNPILPDQDKRFEWQSVGSSNKPLYIGTAPPNSDPAGTVWFVEKYTFVLGPDGTNYVPSRIETRSALAWDNRTSPSPAWRNS